MRQAERRAVRIALVAVILAAAALVTADVVRLATTEDPSRIEQVRDCHEEQRGVAAFSVVPGSVAEDAELGALRTTVEGNDVTYAIEGSEAEAAALAERARAAGPVTVEQRGDVVLIWRDPPSPTQRQAVYDCSY